jgi:hypothetical protein
VYEKVAAALRELKAAVAEEYGQTNFASAYEDFVDDLARIFAERDREFDRAAFVNACDIRGM